MTHPALRKAIELPFELFVDPETSPVLGVTVNVSESGMLVLSESPAEKGIEARFRFARFQGHARVVWAHAGERGSVFMGMEFTRLDDDARAELNSILKSAAIEYRPGGVRPRMRR